MPTLALSLTENQHGKWFHPHHTQFKGRCGGNSTQCVSANTSLTDIQLHVTISDHLLCFCNTRHTSLIDKLFSSSYVMTILRSLSTDM